MNSQFYRFSDIGSPKVVALQKLISDFTETAIKIHNKPYEKGIFPGIVITAVDSMKVRKLIWDNHKEKAIKTKAIIDPRMSIEDAKLYCMNPMSSKDIASYEKSLYTDEQAVTERCTAKSTIYTAGMISGLVAKTVKDFLVKKPYVRTADWSIHANVLSAWKAEPQL
jgi:hypothetical protein